MKFLKGNNLIACELKSIPHYPSHKMKRFFYEGKFEVAII